MIQRQKQSPKTINEQVQRKLAENGIHTDESSKNMPVSADRSENFFTSSSFAFSYSFRANERHFLPWSRENEVGPSYLFLLLRSFSEHFRRKSNQETDTISEPSCQSSSDSGQSWTSIKQQWRCRLGLCWNDDVVGRQSNLHLYSPLLAHQRFICNDDDDGGWSTFGLTLTIKIEQSLLISFFFLFFVDRSRSNNLLWIAISIASVHIDQEKCRQIRLEWPTDRIRFCREFNERRDFS